MSAAERPRRYRADRPGARQRATELSAARSPWRIATVLPAIISAVLGLTVALVITGGHLGLRPASYADGSPIGKLGDARIVPGGLWVRGWDFDPDAPKQPLWTFAKVDGTRVDRTKADLARAFLSQEHPKAGPLHGYGWMVPVPEGQHTVCVAASSIGPGAAARLGCVTKTFDYGPYGQVDTFGTSPGALHIVGWTIDNDDPTQALTTTISVDGYDTTVVADQKRTDLLAKYPKAGPDHGFDVTIPTTQGQHSVCVTAINIGYGSDNSLGCATVTLDDSPRGGVDTVARNGDKVQVEGWAFDPDRPLKPLRIRLVTDAKKTTSLIANRARQDIAAKYPAAG